MSSHESTNEYRVRPNERHSFCCCWSYASILPLPLLVANIWSNMMKWFVNPVHTRLPGDTLRLDTSSVSSAYSEISWTGEDRSRIKDICTYFV